MGATAAPVDFESSLRGQMHELMSTEPPAAPSTPEDAGTTAPPAEDAPAPGSTPDAEPVPPSEPPAGSTPPDQSQPASAASSTSAVEAVAKRGFTISDPKLASEYLRLESELAKMKREEKARLAQPVATAAAPDPTTSQPPTSLTAAVPEPPVQPALPDDGAIAQLVEKHVAEDPRCRALAQEWERTATDLQSLVQQDHAGRLVGGRLFEVESTIREIRRTLAGPSEAMKRLGVAAPDIDEITKADYNSALSRLSNERLELRERAEGLIAHQDQIQGNYDGIRRGYHEHYQAQIRDARAEADRNADIEQKSVGFRQNWEQTVAATFKALNVPAEDQGDISTTLFEAALAVPGAIPLEQLPDFINRIVQRELGRMDRHHRRKSADYAKAKIADAVTPGPAGSAAIASPAKTDNSDWRDSLRSKMRAARR